VTALAFSADGLLLASGGTDTTVLLWKVPGAH
jgi:WD40 repeat protein